MQSVAHAPKSNPPGDESCLSLEGQGDRAAYREPTQQSSTASMALLPRATVLFGPFRGFTFNASVGKGVRSVDPSYIIQDTATPFASLVAYEVGASFAKDLGPASLVAKSVLFQTHVDKDLVFSETEGRNVLGGGSTRTGWVGSVRVAGDHFDVNANGTLVKSVLDDTGLLVPYVPDVVARADAALFGALPLKIREESFRGALAAGFSFVGHRPLPVRPAQRHHRHARRLGHDRWSHYEVAFSGTNLVGQQYRLGRVQLRLQLPPGGRRRAGACPPLHRGGAPRSLFVTFAVNFGGG